MNQKYGTLLGPEIRINRQYFREMCKLIGIYVLFRSPKEGKTYTTQAELDTNYNEPKLVGCIFDEHPSQRTLRKIGWVAELQQNSSIIHVDYDLEGLQQGALFIIPSGLDDGKGRVYRVIKIENSIVYPASVSCEIVPEYVDNFKDATNYNGEDNPHILGEEAEGPITQLTENELELLQK